MNIKFYLSFILIVLGVNLKSEGQVAYNKRAMGAVGTAPKAGDFLNNASLDNVDMTTGTLKVGIPLYEIKVNDISVPITLNYTALGLKVGQEAGPTGMGWELSAGGKIITNVQGKKDAAGVRGTTLYNSYYTLTENPGTYDPYGIHGSLTANIVDGQADGAMDTYTYVLPNGGGTYLSNGLTFPYDPLISIDHVNQRIKTTDGLIYNFAAGDAKTSKQRTYYEPTSTTPLYIEDASFSRDPRTTTWNDYDLSQIISTKFKDTVFFKYQYISLANSPASRLNAKARISTSESIPLYRDVQQTLTQNNEPLPQEFYNKYYDIQAPIIAQSKTEYTTHSRIGAIDFPNGSVRFIYGNDILGRDVLTEIYIYQKIKNDSTVLKKYEFTYDQTQITDFGHYLKTINTYDGKNTLTGTWSFEYNAKLPLNPSVESKAQDRWGFFNGIAVNKTLLENPATVMALRIKDHHPIKNNDGSTDIKYTREEAKALYDPTGQVYGAPDIEHGNVMTYAIPFANRDYDFNYAVMGTLKSVKMPTGATVSYQYEPHKFREYIYSGPSSNRLAFNGGGIRIKSITKDVGHNSMYVGFPEGRIIKKNFEYGEATYATSGAPTETNGYGNVTIPGNVLTNVSSYVSSSTQTTALLTVNNIMLLSHPVNNMSQYNGSYGAYLAVTEYLTDENNVGSFGKTVYYNNLPSSNECPDRPWQASYASWTLDNARIPLIYRNAGVEKAYAHGIAGVKKYAYRNGTYETVEETKYDYKSFNAPLNSATRAISLYLTVTGQMSGPYQGPTEAIRDSATPQNRGGQISNLFNTTHNSNNFGVMDYITLTNLAQEGKTLTYYGKYAYDLIDLATLSNCIKKTSEATTTFGDLGQTLSMSTVKYYYDNPAHLLANRIVTKSSKGDSVINRIKYPMDYSDVIFPPAVLDNVITNLSEPIEEIVTYKTGSTEYLKQATANIFSIQNGAPYISKVYGKKIAGSVVYTPNPNTSSSSINLSLYDKKVSYDSYSKGNVSRYSEGNTSSNAIIWGYNNQYPIAKVANVDEGGYAPADSVAFSNFESTDKGNWAYNGVPVQDLTSPFGKKVYLLSSGAITKPNSITNTPTYPSTSRFVVSYWYKPGAIVNITGCTLGPIVIKNTKAEWTLAEREISNITSILTLSGSGYIDELRLYPYGALMTTYSYEPLVGMTSSIDPKGKIQYYDYDDEQRLKNIRDQDGNIVKSYRYKLGTSN